jgi:thiamine biosynthesis lipoprotein
MRADGYATALIVMGDEEGRRFAEEHGLTALFLVREEGEEFTARATTRFEASFRKTTH